MRRDLIWFYSCYIGFPFCWAFFVLVVNDIVLFWCCSGKRVAGGSVFDLFFTLHLEKCYSSTKTMSKAVSAGMY